MTVLASSEIVISTGDALGVLGARGEKAELVLGGLRLELLLDAEKKFSWLFTNVGVVVVGCNVGAVVVGCNVG